MTDSVSNCHCSVIKSRFTLLYGDMLDLCYEYYDRQHLSIHFLCNQVLYLFSQYINIANFCINTYKIFRASMYIYIRGRHTHRSGSTLRGIIWFIVNHLVNLAKRSSAIYIMYITWGDRRRKRVGETGESCSSVKLVWSHDGGDSQLAIHVPHYLLLSTVTRVLIPSTLRIKIYGRELDVLLFIFPDCMLGLGLGRGDVVQDECAIVAYFSFTWHKACCSFLSGASIYGRHVFSGFIQTQRERDRAPVC